MQKQQGFAGARNIEDVEDEIWVIPKRLAFGRRPKRSFIKKYIEEKKEQAKEPSNKKHKDNPPPPPPPDITTIFNLWRSEWYKEFLPARCEYFYFPLEDANGCEVNDAVATDDDALLKIAKKIVLLLKQDKTGIFVHAYGATRYACVVTLLAWALYANIVNPIEALHRDVFLNQQHICCDFLAQQQQDPLAVRLLKILKTERSGIKQYFFGAPRRATEDSGGSHALPRATKDSGGSGGSGGSCAASNTASNTTSNTTFGGSGSSEALPRAIGGVGGTGGTGGTGGSCAASNAASNAAFNAASGGSEAHLGDPGTKN